MKRLGLGAVLAALCMTGAAASARAEDPKELTEKLQACTALRNEKNYVGFEELKFLSAGKDGFLFRDADMINKYYLDPRTAKYLKIFNDALKASGSKLIMVVVPPKGVIDRDFVLSKTYKYDDALATYKQSVKELESSGVTVVNPFSAMDTKSFYKRDFHWSQKGAEDVAGAVANELNAATDLKDIPEVQFETKRGKETTVVNKYEEFAFKVCGIPTVGETRAEIVTYQKEGADSSALFGDASEPQIMLFGTSFSDESNFFNFAGFLREKLSRDIDNRAMSGGGLGTAVRDYFLMRKPTDKLPKVILWEALAHHTFRGSELVEVIRQVIPAVKGGCDDAHTVLSDKVAVDSAREYVFPDLKDKKLSSEGKYVQFDLPDNFKRQLKLSVMYANGQVETVDLSNGSRSKAEGRFYYYIEGQTDSPLLMIGFETDAPTGEISARLCNLGE